MPSRSRGRLYEIPLLIAAAIVGLALLAPHAPLLAASLAALGVLAWLGLLVAGFWQAMRLRRASRLAMARAAAEHGLDPTLHLDGAVPIYGGVLGIDRERCKLVFADPDGAQVYDYGQVSTVSPDAAYPLGSTTPSWYCVNFRIEGVDGGPRIATRSRMRLRRWLKALSAELGDKVDLKLPG